MAKFVAKALLRTGSIFFSILLLKLAVDGFLGNEDLWVKIIYLAIVLLGIPLIFILTNVLANLIGYGNKGKNNDNVRD